MGEKLNSDLRVLYRGYWVPIQLIPTRVRKYYTQKIYDVSKSRPLTKQEIREKTRV